MTLLTRIFNAVKPANKRINNAYSGLPTNEVNEAVELVVDSIEPKLRYQPGYSKTLYNSVETTLAYISNLVDTIPGPLLITKNAYSSNPDIHAYFHSVKHIQEVFNQSSELREFFSDTDNSHIEHAYALLCMTVEEKTITGMELQNDVVRRDVMQKTLNFCEHKVLSPGKQEADVRKGIKYCIFNCMITYALHEILDIKEQKLGLELQINKLRARLHARQSQGGGLSSLLTNAATADPTSEIHQQLKETEKKMEQLPNSWEAPKYYLESINKTLSEPEKFIKIEEITYPMTQMGIISNGETSETVNTIHINRILIADVLQRAVAIVKYSKDSLLPDHEFKL